MCSFSRSFCESYSRIVSRLHDCQFVLQSLTVRHGSLSQIHVYFMWKRFLLASSLEHMVKGRLCSIVWWVFFFNWIYVEAELSPLIIIENEKSHFPLYYSFQVADTQNTECEFENESVLLILSSQPEIKCQFRCGFRHRHQLIGKYDEIIPKIFTQKIFLYNFLVGFRSRRTCDAVRKQKWRILFHVINTFWNHAWDVDGLGLTFFAVPFSWNAVFLFVRYLCVCWKC